MAQGYAEAVAYQRAHGGAVVLNGDWYAVKDGSNSVIPALLGAADEAGRPQPSLWQQIQRDVGAFGTGIAAAIPGPLGADARATVQETYARLQGRDLPGFVKGALEFAGPPQSELEAWAGLGASALVGGLAVRSAARAGTAATKAAGTASRVGAANVTRATVARGVLSDLGISGLFGAGLGLAADLLPKPAPSPPAPSAAPRPLNLAQLPTTAARSSSAGFVVPALVVAVVAAVALTGGA